MAKPPAPLDAPKQVPAEASPQPPKTKSVQRNFTGERDQPVDRLKLAVAMAKKNRAYQEGVADVEAVEHVHFFNSHDHLGAKQTHSTPACGHVHEITQKREPNGDLVLDSLVCGPALEQKSTRRPNGVIVRTLVPIEHGHDRAGNLVVDDHAHEIQYVKSQILKIKV